MNIFFRKKVRNFYLNLRRTRHVGERWATIFLILCILFMLGFYFSRDSIARVVWDRHHLAEKALWLSPRNAQLAMAIGDYYFSSAEYNLAFAKKGYEQAVRINPKIQLGHYQLARIYFVEGRFREALVKINKELEVYPDNLRPLYVRGLIEGFQGDLAAASADFEKFIAWAPHEWGGYNDRAWILAKLKNYSEMEVTAKRGIEVASMGASNPWLWNMFGVAELNLKKYIAAHEAFIRARQFAEVLTDKEWQRAYPGNDPSGSENGRTAFLAAIKENLEKAKQAVDKAF